MKINAKRVSSGGLFHEDGTNIFVTKKPPFVFNISIGKEKHEVVLPIGFKTDYGSIPSFFRRWINPVKYDAYILHDYLYQIGYFIDSRGKQVFITRRQADLILFYGMKNSNSGYLERNIVLLGLDIGGWYAWNKYRKA